MQIYREIPQLTEPVALTVGTFDGVHKGHQKLLEQLKAESSKHQLKTAVFTFQNHPTSLLKPHEPTLPLITQEHKIQLFSQLSIDYLLFLPFTSDLAELSPEAFFDRLTHKLNIRSLHLGYDAKLGKNRTGDLQKLTDLALHNHFGLHILPPVQDHEEPISSTRIRKHLFNGVLEQVSHLLGRPYSILSTPTPGESRGKSIGFPTINLPLPSMALPPLGVWAVLALIDKKPLKAIANLGYAPTFNRQGPPILEVHLLEPFPFVPKTLEVIFVAYIRQEKNFQSVEELKAQIALDIQKAKALL